MAKRKRERNDTIRQTENPRMALLAKELGVAIHQVLTDYYGFDETEANKALHMVYMQAKSNRELTAAAAISSHLADTQPEGVFTPSALSEIRPTKVKAKRITPLD